MRQRGLAPYLPVAIAVLMVALLAVLAALQWRWIGQVSDMERQRMRATLYSAGGRFVEDFDREVMQVFLAFHPDLAQPPDDRLERVVKQYERWQAEAAYPRLVRDVFLVRRGAGGEPELAVLRPDERRFEPCPWPAELAGLRRHLEQAAQESPAHYGLRGMGPPVMVLGDVPALLIPLVFAQGPEADPAGGPLAGARLLVRLDERTISEEILPVMTRRYFLDARGGDYALEVKALAVPERVVFLSDPSLPASAFAAADLALDMLRPWPFMEMHSLWLRRAERARHWHGPGETRARLGPGPPPGERRPENGAWRLAIKRRDGSLEAAVAAIRHRNLGISLGILALLGAAMVMMMVTAQRAQRLARQQIELVAGVTHELHTPLTAMRSAGQNLADGVVAEPAQVRRYGALIESEGRRLSDMVGQALEFAGIHSGRRVLHLRPAEVTEIIDGALQDCRWLLQERGVQVEREIAPDLPPVLADAASLRRAVQNLVENAVKYGGRAGWLGVRARRSGAGQVEITVADHGPGIRSDDLPHLFEPFFRGRDAAASGVPGSGLGLSLVHHIVEAHGGRITIDAAAERGSAFTLHLPAAAEPAAMPAVEEPA
jgi:signal transduction histidine kinase